MSRLKLLFMFHIGLISYEMFFKTNQFLKLSLYDGDDVIPKGSIGHCRPSSQKNVKSNVKNKQ